MATFKSTKLLSTTRLKSGFVCLGLLASVCSTAQAYEVVHSNRSLAQIDTHLAPASYAPKTRLESKPFSGDLASSQRSTSLQPKAVAQTVLRQTEVPPQRLERTRELIQELKAEPTPQNAISVDLPADVLFDFDKAELRVDAQPSLEKAAELIESYPGAPITVRGHTDGKGSDSYNDHLSQRRAQAVAQVIESRTQRHASTQGLGKREPVAPNTRPDGSDDPQGRQLNRRVQILIGVPTKGG